MLVWYLTTIRDMRVYVNFLKLALSWDSSYIELLEWITKKNAVVSSNNINEKCFKRADIAALSDKETDKELQPVPKLQCYENQYGKTRKDLIFY